MAGARRPDQAAIASAEAGDRHGLVVLARDIANQALNFTRFVVVAARPSDCDPLHDAKVSLVFGTQHERGALVRCLNVLADEGVSLTKLESRPKPGTAWEYVFYVDVEGHLAEPRMQSALAGLAEATQFLRVLGCYPRAVTAPGTLGPAGIIGRLCSVHLPSSNQMPSVPGRWARSSPGPRRPGSAVRAARLIHMSKADAEGFYHVHRERPFFGGLTDFMSSGPCLVLCLEAPDAIKKWRDLMGATDPAKAAAGTLRKDFGASIDNNATHGSDAPETAAFELGYFFRGLELR